MTQVMSIKNSIESLVAVKDQEIFTTSRIFGEEFGIEHKALMRSIRKEIDYLETIKSVLSCTDQNIQFIESSFKDIQNRTQPEYKITKDGFMTLVMAMGSAKGETARIRIRTKQQQFIQAFNKMEQIIRDRQIESQKALGFMEDSKLTGYPKTKFIKTHYRTDTSKKRKELGKQVNLIIRELDKVNNLDGGLIDYTDIVNRLEDKLADKIDELSKYKKLSILGA